MSGSAATTRNLLSLERTTFVSILAGDAVPCYGEPRVGAVFVDGTDPSTQAAAWLEGCTFQSTIGSDVGLSDTGRLFADAAGERVSLNAKGAGRQEPLSAAAPSFRFLSFDDPALAAIREARCLRACMIRATGAACL